MHNSPPRPSILAVLDKSFVHPVGGSPKVLPKTSTVVSLYQSMEAENLLLHKPRSIPKLMFSVSSHRNDSFSGELMVLLIVLGIRSLRCPVPKIKNLPELVLGTLPVKP